MKRARALPWTWQEIAILHDVYAAGGLDAAADALPDRSWGAITTMAAKLGIRSSQFGAAPEAVLQGARLEEAIRLREVERWAFARIGRHFGVCETAASNAILMALCPRKGFTPAEREENGRLSPDGIERVRALLAQGLKGVDISLQLGISAACVAEQRRRYERELRESGGRSLPPPGNGARYSGARIDRATMREVERLLLTGLGTPKIAHATGVSKVHVQRQRTRLVTRMKRVGECLPGCDVNGRRIRVFDTVVSIPEGSKNRLRDLLLDGTPVARAARMAAIGKKSAYAIRDALRAELESRGEVLPPIKRLGRLKAPAADARASWLPPGRNNLILFRRMLAATNGDEQLAKLRTLDALKERMPEPAITPPRRLTFEEKLELVRSGKATISAKVFIPRAAPAMTLGGVSAGALA